MITITNDTFTAEGTADNSGYCAQWKIWEVDGIKESPQGDVIMKGELFAEGHVKWDGCSNWSFHTEGCMYHACTHTGLTDIGEILKRCWMMTRELIPTHWNA